MILIDENDKFEVVVDGAKFTLRSLTFDENKEVAECISIDGGDFKQDTVKAIMTTLRHSILAIEGVKKMDGSEYEFTFKDGKISDKDLKTLFSNMVADKVYLAVSAIKRGEVGKVKSSDGSNHDFEVKYVGNC